MRHHAVGPRALLVDVPDAVAAAALARWARAAGVAAVDVVPAATTVLFDGVPDLDVLRGLLQTAPQPGADDVAAPPVGDPVGVPVEVPVRWDGPDLAFVAGHWDVDEATVVERLERTELVSAFCGFAPGFAYLAGLPEEWAVPRLDDPRARVPAGSVALAGSWCSVYPGASPGGWRLVGTTDLALWDVDRDPPALLAPGTRVRLVTEPGG